MNGRRRMKNIRSRNPFTVEEDAKLIDIMTNSKFISWEFVASQMPGRRVRQCRERWFNYLNPSIRTDPWTAEEDQHLLEKVNELGRSWSNICVTFDGRSENDVKNRWYSHIKYEVFLDQFGIYHFLPDQAQRMLPMRKKRNRVKVSPQLNALKVLEQKKAKQDESSESNVNFYQDKIIDEEPTEIIDFWDRQLVNDYTDAMIEFIHSPSGSSISSDFIFE